MPDESLQVHHKRVWRLNSSRDWKKRILILTKEDLLVGLEGHDFVIEKIPLVNLSLIFTHQGSAYLLLSISTKFRQ